jgi:hypothetical protein
MARSPAVGSSDHAARCGPGKGSSLSSGCAAVQLYESEPNIVGALSQGPSPHVERHDLHVEYPAWEFLFCDRFVPAFRRSYCEQVAGMIIAVLTGETVCILLRQALHPLDALLFVKRIGGSGLSLGDGD